jgi:hypothetical protein
MYVPLDLVTGDVFTQARAAFFETQFEEGVDQTFTGPTISGGTLTLDLAGSRVFSVALNANITSLTITNVPASRLIVVTLVLTADGTPRTVTFGAAFRTPSGITYTPTATLDKRDWLTLSTFNGGTAWDVSPGPLNL